MNFQRYHGASTRLNRLRGHLSQADIDALARAIHAATSPHDERNLAALHYDIQAAQRALESHGRVFSANESLLNQIYPQH